MRVRRYLAAAFAKELRAGKALFLLADGPFFHTRKMVIRTVARLPHRLEQGNVRPLVIFVTHHVEEIMPAFSHVLVLKEGKCVARGRKEDLLLDEVLSEAFGIAIQVTVNNGRYAAGFAAA